MGNGMSWRNTALLMVFLYVVGQAFSYNVTECDGFSCDDGGCVAATTRCDEVTDCRDGSDERNCDYQQCSPPLWMKCNNGHCISVQFRCDTHNDCQDWSDELSCDKQDECDDEEFRCADQECIPQKWVCDGAEDCRDGSDETNATCRNSRQRVLDGCTGFVCGNGECLLERYRCDGVLDCDDGSDEVDCGSTGKSRVDCTDFNTNYRCSDGLGCIPWKQVCDKKPHCDDGSDEGKRCNNKCQMASKGCSVYCRETPEGPRCYCKPGFQLASDQTTCIDRDECVDYPPVCSQMCDNLPGKYRCSCQDGYQLYNDTKCRATGPSALLIFSTSDQIRGYYMTQEKYLLIQKDRDHIGGVDYDGRDHRVYWSEDTLGDAAIYSSDLDGSDVRKVISGGLELPQDVAVDWIGRNLYFLDDGTRNLAACSLQTSICATIVEGLDKPRSLALDPKNRLVYWTEWGENAQIGRSGMDGINPTSFVDRDVFWPNGLTIDHSADRIYWCDAHQRKVETVDFNGNDRRTVISNNVHRPFSVAVFEERLFWTDLFQDAIDSSNKYNGRDRHVLLKENRLKPVGIHVYHKVLQRTDIENPCNHRRCSHLCVLSPRRPHYRCVCPSTLQLAHDKHVCKEAEEQSRLLVSRGDSIFSLLPHSIGDGLLKDLPLTINFHVIGDMDYSPVSGNLIISDLDVRRIYSINIKTRVANIIAEKFVEAEGIAVDAVTENVYWTDPRRGTVMLSNSNGSLWTTVLEGLSNPIGISVDTKKGYLFVSEVGGSSSRIVRYFMDGSGEVPLVTKYLNKPIDLFTDTEERRLYWSDPAAGTIASVDYNGRAQTSFKVNIGSPSSLLVTSDTIFWTDRYDQKLYWAVKNTTTSSRTHSYEFQGAIARFSVPKLSLMTSLDTRRFFLGHPCASNNGGCSHFCVSVSVDVRSCLCPIGTVRGPSGRNCVPQDGCTDGRFQCMDGQCIKDTLKCDGKNDCYGGEDEANCTSPCTEHDFSCDSGTCAPINWVCDGEPDCDDGSDESTELCSNKTLESNYFSCGYNQTAIPDSWVCDHEPDCVDGRDELPSLCPSTNCGADQFRCDNGQCVQADWECDSMFDCSDRSDEHDGCPPLNETVVCLKGSFRCLNGRCVSEQVQCDGYDDCNDGSDEVDCSEDHIAYPSWEEGCNDITSFYCTESKTCLPKNKRCDGKIDCDYEEDEEDCPCQDDQFRCPNGHCIPQEWICDQHDDCGDKGDEAEVVCAGGEEDTGEKDVYETTQCPPDQYMCNTGECLSLDKVCNRQPDCADGSDEWGDDQSCDKSCNSNGGCMGSCRPTPRGPFCSCGPGFELQPDGRSCQDVDECQKMDVCSQSCTNTKGSFKCRCKDGYVLEADFRTCRAVGAAAQVLFISAGGIRAVSADGHQLQVWDQTDNVVVPHSLAAMYSGNVVYMTDVDHRGIYEYHVDTGDMVVLMLGQGQPDQLVLDWVTETLYYTEQVNNTARIRACDVTRRECVTVITFPNVAITAIAIDPEARFLFVTHWFPTRRASRHVERPHWRRSHGAVLRLDLDGRRLAIVADQHVRHPVAVAVDAERQEVYWVDAQLGIIEMTTYNGDQRRTLNTNGDQRPVSVSVFEDQVYWLEDHSSTIVSCNKFSMQDCRALQSIKKGPSKHTLVMVHKVLQRAGPTNPCNHHRCSHVCLPSTGGYLCACPDGHVSKNSTHCSTRVTSPRNLRSCRPNPCMNGGSCKMVMLDMVKCSCTDGYGGPSCTDQISSDSSTEAVVAVLILLVVVGVVAAVVYIKKFRKEPIVLSLHFHKPQFTRRSQSSVSVDKQNLTRSYSNPVFQHTDSPADVNSNYDCKLEIVSPDLPPGSVDSAFASQISLASEPELDLQMAQPPPHFHSSKEFLIK